MSNYIVKDTELTSVANAIRIKGGTNSQLVFPGGFVSAIGNISGGGSSDFSTAEVTFNSRPIDDYEASVPFYDDPSGLGLLVQIYTSDEPFTLQVPIYKGGATLLLSRSTLILSGDIEAGGDVSLFGLNLKAYYITGDCTIS